MTDLVIINVYEFGHYVGCIIINELRWHLRRFKFYNLGSLRLPQISVLELCNAFDLIGYVTSLYVRTLRKLVDF